jgi:hypothetical protein
LLARRRWLKPPNYDAGMTDYHYVPPEFELYEFDDTLLGPSSPARRWCRHWNGPVGQPADEVILGWTAGSAAVLVATSGRPGDEDTEWSRMGAAHLALGGTFLSASARPATTREVGQEMRRIAGSPGLWSPGPVIVPGEAPADLADLNGYVLARSEAGNQQLLIAAVGVEPGRLRARRVGDWTVYDLDATRGHSLSDLSQARQDQPQ